VRDVVGDLVALFELLDPEVVWDNGEYGPIGHRGLIRGKAAVSQIMREWVGTWAEYRFEVGEMVEIDDQVLLAVNESGVGKGSGIPLQAQHWFVWSFRAGRIVHAAAFRTKAEALARMGLRCGRTTKRRGGGGEMETNRGLKVGAVALALAALVASAVGAPAAPTVTPLSAQLKGNAEVPGPGDKNGKGEAFISVKVAKRALCWQVSAVKIADPTAAHIHKGAKGVAGPVKVALFDRPQPDPIAEGCARKQRRKLLKRIARAPQKFYVNVHNSEFPDGAIRGQLGPAL